MCFISALRADTIVLTNGEHREGQIVAEDSASVSIRTRFKTSNIYYVEKIKRSDIARLERSEPSPAAAAGGTERAAAPGTRPAEAELPAAKITDKAAFLDAAIRKYQKPDYHAAGMDLTLLIHTSKPGELARLSDQVESQLKMSLAELAARAHFNDAMQRSRGRAVQFQYVTEYEKPQLIPLIEEAYQKAVAMVVVPPAPAAGGDDPARPGRAGDARENEPERSAGREQAEREPAERRQTAGRPTDRRERSAARGQRERPAVRGREPQSGPEAKVEGPEKKADSSERPAPASRPAMSIASWLDHPEDFNGTPSESAMMAIQIYHASTLVAERLRLDPEVRKDPALKSELSKRRADLAALLKSVRARGGGALTPAEREALDAQQRNLYDAARRAQMNRDRDLLEELQRAIEQQQRQQQPPGPARPAPPAPSPRPDNGPEGG
jgi:hypothetical protein